MRGQTFRSIGKGVGIVLALLVFGLGILLFLAVDWSIDFFGEITIDEIIFHLKVPLQGTDQNTILDFIIRCLIPALMGMFLLALLYLLPRWERRWREKRVQKGLTTLCVVVQGGKHREIRRGLTLIPALPVWIVWLIALVSLGCGLIHACQRYPIIEYIEMQSQNSTWIEEEYVDPDASLLTFPEEKRNLIYIYLESMEASYMSEEDGGFFEEDLIPELTELARENLHFSSLAGTLRGAAQIENTGWTIAGMFAQTAGLPLKMPIDRNTMGEYSSFFPGVTSLGELLEAEGYHNYLMIGSDAVFGGRANYFTQHGNYTIYDYYWALENGKIPEDYYVFWGFEDWRLFEMAKEQLLQIAEQEEPFNFTMLTVDTHFPDGYICPLCQSEHNTSYENALSCSSRQVASFVQWVQQQDFYEDTTIVIAGDHLTMAAEFVETMPEDAERSTYHAIINAPVTAAHTEERVFTTLDMFPTTLAALGVEIEGDRLALGTNLFSERETLAEEYGLDVMNQELMRKSEFYNRKLMYGS